MWIISSLFWADSGNVGLLLDTGHLINTNPDIRYEKDGADYVTKVIKVG